MSTDLALPNEVMLPDFDSLPNLEWFQTRGFNRWNHGRVDHYMQMYELREKFLKEYGFSVPCREAIELLAKYGPIVEIGAGSGYWARLMYMAGVDVIATDAYESQWRFQVGKHYPVERQKGAAAVKLWPSRTVFVSWPSYDDPWSYSAAKVMEVGRHLIYIGEGPSGCTGCDKLHELLEADFEVVETQGIPQFPGIGDHMTVYRRVR